MKLIITPTSPYARKARILIREKNLQCEETAGAPWDDDPAILQANPLRKVPVLLPGGDAAPVFDSRVICQYLDSLAEPRFLPADASARAATQTREALAEGAMDSALAVIMAGRVAPDMKSADSWKMWLMSKARRAIDAAESEAPARMEAAAPDMADVAWFCFLDFWLFRMPQMEWDWRPESPQLAKWFEKFGARPSAQQTDPRQG